jgi:dTMP kinase
MKIYFGAAITLSRKNLPKYQKIVHTLEFLGHKVLSKHVVDPQLTEGKWQEQYDPQKLYQREIKRVEEADAMVVEVSTPSWGTPFLMAHALEHNIPVLALFYADNPQEIPLMIKGHPDLYTENYDEDNIKIILEKYLKHFEKLHKHQGKLVVIDGGDGSGKQTQADLLVEYLKKKGLKVKYYDFPRYYTSFHGKMVARFLNGEFGKLEEISPYLASLAYALDRASLKEEMDDWLSRGGIVVSNRYATSSMAHQAAKLPSKNRQEFIEWLDELEYKVHKIPREDIVIYLYVPWQIGFELTKKKRKRGYLNGKKLDIAEADLKHRQESEAMYLWLAKNRPNWVKVECLPARPTGGPAGRQAVDGKLRPKEDIHREILKVLKEKKII